MSNIVKPDSSINNSNLNLKINTKIAEIDYQKKLLSYININNLNHYIKSNSNIDVRINKIEQNALRINWLTNNNDLVLRNVQEVRLY